jgi:hypothetical protein
MNSRLAGFLTRLYPRTWQARYGEEYRLFLETRRVSRLEILDVIAQAAVENVREAWRSAPILLALLFSVEGGLCLAGGHARETIAQHPALACAWFALEAGALAVLCYALSLSIAIPWKLEIAPKHSGWILFPAAAAWAVLQYLPWRWTSGWLATLTGGFATIAGILGIGFAGMFAKILLGRLKELEPEDVETLTPFIRNWWSKTSTWGPVKFEALRLSVMILSSTLFASQMRRVDPLVSTYILIGTSLALFWDDVFHVRGVE